HSGRASLRLASRRLRKLAFRLKQSRPPAQLRQELLRPSCNAPCGSPVNLRTRKPGRLTTG
ncbi:MAG: hypothetical protein K9K62_02960, partial [Desulfobacteraceae bacterium]|nr:hypothetical protein [Desulfobacteraceae bacterium]